MTPEQLLEILRDHVESLGEHFDSVQIFTSTHDGEKGTFTLNYGSGNWFARFGQVQEWITKSSERTKEIVRHEEND